MTNGRAEGETIPSGTFGRGGHRRIAGLMWFEGRLGSAFASFAEERARRLSLKGDIRWGAQHAMVRIEGPEALIGAFEMACIIGPESCQVDDWRCSFDGSQAADIEYSTTFEHHARF
ncbi:MAG: hypothetical protein AAF543_21030 [Pseudomonadota bacterium]